MVGDNVLKILTKRGVQTITITHIRASRWLRIWSRWWYRWWCIWTQILDLYLHPDLDWFGTLWKELWVKWLHRIHHATCGFHIILADASNKNKQILVLLEWWELAGLRHHWYSPWWVRDMSSTGRKSPAQSLMEGEQSPPSLHGPQIKLMRKLM